MDKKHDALETGTEAFARASDLLDNLKSNTPEALALRGSITDKKATAISDIQNTIGSMQAPVSPPSNADMSERLESLLDDDDIEPDEQIEKESLSFEGEEIGEEYLEEWTTERPGLPQFPIIIFTLALIQDSLDFLDLTVIGTVIAFAFSVLVSLIIIIWKFGKSKWWQNKFALQWFFTFLLADIIPFVGMFPWQSILIVMIYYREKKVVRALWKIIDLFEHELYANEYRKR